MRRLRCHKAQLFLASAFLCVAALFIISTQYQFRNLQAVLGNTEQHFTTETIGTTNTRLQEPMKNATRLGRFINVTRHGPLNDYVNYPCVKGVPLFPKKKWIEYGKCVRTIDQSDVNTENQENCVPLKTFTGSTIICTYHVEKDVFVSADVQRNAQWENTLVSNMGRLLRSESDAELLDIGCNIGTYTLAIAHQGTRVTAIDPLLTNLQLLSKSLKLAQLQDKVTLIWNAVSNEHTLVALDSPYGNIGGTVVREIDSDRQSDVVKRNFARTITLNDLVTMFEGKRLVVKMDIEGSEYSALLGASLFFESVDIILLQLEFMMHKHGQNGQNIVNFLASKGLEPYLDLGKSMPLKTSDISEWSDDVYFMKP